MVFIAIYVRWPSSEQGPCDRRPREPNLRGPVAGLLGGRNGTFPWACLKVVTMLLVKIQIIATLCPFTCLIVTNFFSTNKQT